MTHFSNLPKFLNLRFVILQLLGQYLMLVIEPLLVLELHVAILLGDDGVRWHRRCRQLRYVKCRDSRYNNDMTKFCDELQQRKVCLCGKYR